MVVAQVNLFYVLLIYSILGRKYHLISIAYRQRLNTIRLLEAVLRIRSDLEPDPVFLVPLDPDPDPVKKRIRILFLQADLRNLRGSVSSVTSHGTEGVSSIPAQQYNILLASSTPTDGIKLQSLSEVITLNDINCKPVNTQQARVR